MAPEVEQTLNEKDCTIYWLGLPKGLAQDEGKEMAHHGTASGSCVNGENEHHHENVHPSNYI